MTTINHKCDFSKISVDETWSFRDCGVKERTKLTHGYYTYPAKYIPQLCERLIKENSSEGDIVLDPFNGCGTTVIEAVLNNRTGIGGDVNEISILVATVKTRPIKYDRLIDNLNNIKRDFPILLQKYPDGIFDNISNIERIDHWFREDIKIRLSILFNIISNIIDDDIKNFFLVAFCQILKKCSWWSTISPKPYKKVVDITVEPFDAFVRQANKMIKKHKQFTDIVGEAKISAHNIYSDCRKFPRNDESVDLIVTSPPYSISYEYADLHELPLLWLNIKKDRSKFIGTRSIGKGEEDKKISSITAYDVIHKLSGKNKNVIAEYYYNMELTFREMHRLLRKNKRMCVVIGNGKIKNIDLLNAEVFVEQCNEIGFKTVDVIKRPILSKRIPSQRDENGTFVKASDQNNETNHIYEYEYILILEKI
jgi:DNA modification methylase